MPHAALTPERYVADGHELVQYLRRRFGQEKVYLVGESWGSALGVWLVQRHPELFHAFAGTGQMVAFLETDRLDYALALRLARERGDAKKVAALERQGPPPYYGEGVAWKQAAYLLDGFADMNADPAIAADGFDTVQDLLSPEYGLYDKANWARGVLDSLDAVYPQLWEVDLRTQLPRLEVPVVLPDRAPRRQRPAGPGRGLLPPAPGPAQGVGLVRALRPHPLGQRVGAVRGGAGGRVPRGRRARAVTRRLVRTVIGFAIRRGATPAGAYRTPSHSARSADRGSSTTAGVVSKRIVARRSRSYRGHPASPWSRRRPRLRAWRRPAPAAGRRPGPASVPLVERVEDEGDLERVAGAEHAAELPASARRTRTCTWRRGSLRMRVGQAERRDAAPPVGLDRREQLARRSAPGTPPVRWPALASTGRP